MNQPNTTYEAGQARAEQPKISDISEYHGVHVRFSRLNPQQDKVEVVFSRPVDKSEGCSIMRQLYVERTRNNATTKKCYDLHSLALDDKNLHAELAADLRSPLSLELYMPANPNDFPQESIPTKLLFCITSPVSNLVLRLFSKEPVSDRQVFTLKRGRSDLLKHLTVPYINAVNQ